MKEYLVWGQQQQTYHFLDHSTQYVQVVAALTRPPDEVISLLRGSISVTRKQPIKEYNHGYFPSNRHNLVMATREKVRPQ